MKKCTICGETKKVDLFRKGRSQCKACTNARQKRYSEQPETRASKIAYQRKRYALSGGKARAATYRKENRAAAVASQRKHNAHPEVKAASSIYHKRRNARPEVKAANAARHKEYRALNSEKFNVSHARRRARKLQATVPWEDRKAVAGLYHAAKVLTALTGARWHVDHIFPLKPRDEPIAASGLHCAANLHVVRADVNISKGNSYPVGQPDAWV